MKNRERKTILLVEDDLTTLMAHEHLLRNFGYEVVPAKSGKEAVEIATGHDKIDLVLMDIYLGPGMDGAESARQILGKRHLPIVFLSSHTDKEYVERIKGSVGYGYVIKNSGEVVLHSSIEMAFNLFEAEAALRESEGQKKAILNGIGTNIALVDKELKILWANQASANSVSKRPEEMVGQMCYSFWGDSVKPCANCPTIRAFQSGQSEHKIVETPDGRIWDERGEPVFDAAGKVIAVVEIAQDITERKRAEEELQTMRKLQSVGTLAGGIAHDFNNILMGLYGNISLAKDELPKEHPCYTLLEEAEKSMNRAVRLTKQLLTFAKGGDPVKEVVSLGAIVEEVAQFDLSGSEARLVFRQVEDLWPAEVDHGQIQQVISNLAINARQAMPEGGRLYIALENADIPEAAIPGLRQGKYVKVTLRDEGTGIEPKHLGLIFDPYFSTKQTGSGLGLATVYSIVHKHGGHIGVVSDLGKGTTFTLYLPASESPQRAEAPPAAAEGPALARPARILAMDDEKPICDIIARMLKQCGFTVATAPDGQEAIEMYKQALEAGAPFDAVIMDLTIPGGIGGKEAIENLLAIDPQARAIVSSGYAGDPVMANYAEYGFKGVAIKPYTQSELLDVLARVLKPDG